MILHTRENTIHYINLFLFLLSTDHPISVVIDRRDIELIDGKVLPSFHCTSLAKPDPEFYWKKKDGETIVKGKVLTFNKGIEQKDVGFYTCVAKNKHGSREWDVYVNVS
jgi:hypothetical protein